MFKIGFKEELEEAEVIIKKYEKSLHTYENIIETKGKMVVSFLLLLFIPKKKMSHTFVSVSYSRN